MRSEHAAKLWATIEKILVERCGLSTGAALHRERAGLIRRLGGRAQPETAIHDDTAPPPHPPEQPAEIAPGKTVLNPIAGNFHEAFDQRLEQLIERACSGYDTDDRVSH